MIYYTISVFKVKTQSKIIFKSIILTKQLFFEKGGGEVKMFGEGSLITKTSKFRQKTNFEKIF